MEKQGEATTMLRSFPGEAGPRKNWPVLRVRLLGFIGAGVLFRWDFKICFVRDIVLPSKGDRLFSTF